MLCISAYQLVLILPGFCFVHDLFLSFLNNRFHLTGVLNITFTFLSSQVIVSDHLSQNRHTIFNLKSSVKLALYVCSVVRRAVRISQTFQRPPAVHKVQPVVGTQPVESKPALLYPSHFTFRFTILLFRSYSFLLIYVHHTIPIFAKFVHRSAKNEKKSAVTANVIKLR